jgi:MFS family permease
LGLGVIAIGYFAFAFLLTSTTQLEQIEVMLAVVGVGLGLFSSPNVSSLMGSVPPQRRGVASAVRATTWNVGNVVSISLVAYIITTVIPYQIVSGIINGGYTTLTPVESMAFVTGMRHAFIFTALITLIGMFASNLRGEEPMTLTF